MFSYKYIWNKNKFKIYIICYILYIDYHIYIIEWWEDENPPVGEEERTEESEATEFVGICVQPLWQRLPRQDRTPEPNAALYICSRIDLTFSALTIILHRR